jgi:hypothetical protein
MLLFLLVGCCGSSDVAIFWGKSYASFTQGLFWCSDNDCTCTESAGPRRGQNINRPDALGLGDLDGL